jgi:hypothetical protein
MKHSPDEGTGRIYDIPCYQVEETNANSLPGIEVGD